MRPGVYRAKVRGALHLKQRNGDRPASDREWTAIERGHTFEVPETVNEFFYAFESLEREPGEPVADDLLWERL